MNNLNEEITRVQSLLTVWFEDGDSPLGLCAILRHLSGIKISFNTKMYIQGALDKKIETQTVFYDCIGAETKWNDQFVWHPMEYQKRYDFLENLKQQ